MGVLEQDLQKQLTALQQQLEHARLTQRDSSFKYQREQKVLRRMITSLSINQCDKDNPRLNQSLSELCQALEQKKDVSDLIPKIAVLERLLKQQAIAMEKHTHQLDNQVKHSGEALLRVNGLPAKVKRDLRDLLSYSNGLALNQSDHLVKLLSIYERTIKIIAANPDSTIDDLASSSEKELLSKLSTELQHLITELDFEGESGEMLLEIRAKLLLGLNSQSLLEITLQTLKLVVEATKFERKTSEQFLAQVNTTLANNLKSAAQSLDQTQSYFQQRQITSQELNNIVQRSHLTVSNAVTLEGLKTNISPLLDKIATLSERLQVTEQREQALIARMYNSNNQLESLYELTQDYRRRLELQSQKMQLDPLTKAYNRNAFIERLELEYRKWIRKQNPLRVVLLDIDNFKAINESFGYSAGDKALKIIVRTISKELNEHEVLARFSGQEFAIILPDRSSSDGYKLIQTIQRQVSKLPFKFKEQSIIITASAVSTMFSDNDTPETVLDRLNTNLSQAKRKGTNQLVWHSSD
ncbi:diguanylate cyclase (GGDEF) domain-containing protein [Vibrio xiamenensis]|uniref:diguanylate cyclase n=1 Tax=Vibrio xiamenensis TaxID=861298 RepID=A0A1G8H5Y2_9VIBR|nr:GGDEF domain-containing protein [Vibrio xiamenensis]SDI01920.1 diguanylate cyclase (GGDEF) domain-containing protein [Vibrio xiamenensis]